MAIIKTGTFNVTLGGAAQNLNLGFVPSVLTLWNDTKLTSGTGVAYAQWLDSMANATAYIQTLTAGAPVWTLAATNGVTPFVTPGSALYPPSNRVITAITKAANAQITSTAHGFTSADVGVTSVTFHSVVGMTQINTLTGLIQSIVDANNFTVNINSTGFTTYVSGGIANVITGIPPVEQVGFQVFNTPLFNAGIIGVTLGTALMVTTADLFRYEAVLNTPVTS